MYTSPDPDPEAAPMAPDISDHLPRLRAHIGCLERAGADESAPPEIRAHVAAMAQAARTAADVAERVRTDPDAAGDPTSNDETKEETRG
ncbi:hypothetical protein ABZ897_00550 [Nonomuraea sp. NPDC046802]|uniref:hypothetical protein n=1 Tax=Nonomuraea sp. NPDC046802 TaxID=3154919 RepID=UPI0033E57BBB